MPLWMPPWKALSESFWSWCVQRQPFSPSIFYCFFRPWPSVEMAIHSSFHSVKRDDQDSLWALEGQQLIAMASHGKDNNVTHFLTNFCTKSRPPIIQHRRWSAESTSCVSACTSFRCSRSKSNSVNLFFLPSVFDVSCLVKIVYSSADQPPWRRLHFPGTDWDS
jgi:hypothetical protein